MCCLVWFFYYNAPPHPPKPWHSLALLVLEYLAILALDKPKIGRWHVFSPKGREVFKKQLTNHFCRTFKIFSY